VGTISGHEYSSRGGVSAEIGLRVVIAGGGCGAKGLEGLSQIPNLKFRIE